MNSWFTCNIALVNSPKNGQAPGLYLFCDESLIRRNLLFTRPNSCPFSATLPQNSKMRIDQSISSGVLKSIRVVTDVPKFLFLEDMALWSKKLIEKLTQPDQFLYFGSGSFPDLSSQSLGRGQAYRSQFHAKPRTFLSGWRVFLCSFSRQGNPPLRHWARTLLSPLACPELIQGLKA